MTIIRRIINWIKELFKRLFGINNSKKKRIKKQNNKSKDKQDKQKLMESYFDDTLPSYMIISDKEREKLLYAIGLVCSFLLEKNESLKEKESI